MIGLHALVALALALAPSSAAADAPAPATAPAPAEARSADAPAPAYRFANGVWFDGRGFAPATFYSRDGVLSRSGPADAVLVDLKGGFVVPPFADAHNHYIAGPHDIDRILAEYLRDGIFYAKNP